MWLFCKSGFFSAVQHKNDSGTIHVRARFNGDLERLCGVHGVASKVTFTPDHDYAYRMDFTRDKWSRIVQAEAQEIDYGNFKASVHDGTARDSAYLNCWSAMRRAQS